jgi:hypothetical protein
MQMKRKPCAPTFTKEIRGLRRVQMKQKLLWEKYDPAGSRQNEVFGRSLILSPPSPPREIED